mmetsp:Transcript_33003/g.29256  ORF Transcript_33003/g.29256 Transcript_33003/m.29256 type:complete len:116 (+) Transcript_33003:517-864(+)
MSLLLHAFSHVNLFNISKSSLELSCDNPIKIDKSTRFQITYIDMRFIKCSKKSLSSLFKSLSINPNILSSLLYIFYNDIVAGNRIGHWHTVGSLKKEVLDLEFKAIIARNWPLKI